MRRLLVTGWHSFHKLDWVQETNNKRTSFEMSKVVVHHPAHVNPVAPMYQDRGPSCDAINHVNERSNELFSHSTT